LNFFAVFTSSEKENLKILIFNKNCDKMERIIRELVREKLKKGEISHVKEIAFMIPNVKQRVEALEEVAWAYLKAGCPYDTISVLRAIASIKLFNHMGENFFQLVAETEEKFIEKFLKKELEENYRYAFKTAKNYPPEEAIGVFEKIIVVYGNKRSKEFGIRS
jgi:hypothetical protein